MVAVCSTNHWGAEIKAGSKKGRRGHAEGAGIKTQQSFLSRLILPLPLAAISWKTLMPRQRAPLTSPDRCSAGMEPMASGTFRQAFHCQAYPQPPQPALPPSPSLLLHQPGSSRARSLLKDQRRALHVSWGHEGAWLEKGCVWKGRLQDQSCVIYPQPS